MRRPRRRGRPGTLLAALGGLAALAACSVAPDEPREQPEPRDPSVGVEDAGGSSSDEGGADEGGATDPTSDAEQPSAAPSSGESVASRPVEPPPASREEVVRRAGHLLAGVLDDLDEEGLGVLVVDEHGRSVIEHRAESALLPASTLKIVTAAAALVTHGPGARFTTTLELTGSVDGDGALRGDLVLVGSGDPVLATEEYGRWVYPARPRTPLEELADAVVEAGVTRVEGDVVGTSRGFEGPSVASGWPDRYFSGFDARHADGLSVDAGLRTIVTYPDADDDAEESDDVTGERDRDDSSAGRDRAADARPGPADAGDRGDPDVRVDHAEQPARQAATELVRLLEERGVEVAGAPTTQVPFAAVTGRLGGVSSPPLDELLRFAVQRSDNQITDAVFRAVGRQRTGTGSFASGQRALRQVLDHLGVDHAGAVFADGSGLSRDDRASARLLVDVDRAMHATRHVATWRSLMAVTGRSGTLQQRLRGTIAEGRFAGKTGTLRDVTGIVGSVHGDDGRRYHLAILANDPGGGRWLARVLADELVLLLTADLDGCEVDERDAETVLGTPALRFACAA